MAEVIWVELLSRQRDVVARHRCVGDEVRIGRSYANDVVLDDPRVAPAHLRIFRDPSGALVAEDLGSAGGLLVGRDRRPQRRVVLDGDQPIRIGDTWLRIRDAAYAVAPERAAARERWRWPALAAASGALLGSEALLMWLRETTDGKPWRYLTAVLAIALVIAGWTAGWATLSRIFAGAARFERHLLIALGGVLAYSLGDEVVAFLAFALSWPLLSAYFYVAVWGLLGIVCFLHLRAVEPSRLALKGAAVAALMAIAVLMQSLSLFEGPANIDQQYLRRLLPPSFHLAPAASEDRLFADIEQLRRKLDHDRTKDPAPAWLPALFDEED